jgi:hypothetical protein
MKTISNSLEDKMKKGVIIFLLAFTLIAIFSINQCSSAQDFKIEKVVEIGPADWVPLLWPIKWSPDGTKISYFNKGYLMISDTLGNSHQVMKVDMMPFRYEWVSNEEIAITFKGQEKAGAIPYKLSLFNIDNASETVLEQFLRNGSSNDSIIVSDFNGPFRTVEGAVIYQISKSPVSGSGEYRSFTPSALRSIMIQSRLKSNSVSSSSSANHIARWGTSGLYLVNADGSDSTRIAAKPYDNMNESPSINPDRSYIIMGGTMLRLVDSTYIILDTMIKEQPVNTTQCGFTFSTLNPSYNEVLFQLTCDDEISYEINRIGTFNYSTNKLFILDSIPSLTNSVAPVYSPDGANIAVLANYKACLIIRRVR